MKKLEELGASPAPWEIDDPWTGDIICHLKNGIEYQVATPYIHSDEETDANARLIAAAPELYDAAERYVRFHEESCIHGNRTAGEIIADANNAFKDLKAALAKAAGENGGEA